MLLKKRNDNYDVSHTTCTEHLVKTATLLGAVLSIALIIVKAYGEFVTTENGTGFVDVRQIGNRSKVGYFGLPFYNTSTKAAIAGEEDDGEEEYNNDSSDKLGALLCITGSWRSFLNSPAIIRSFDRLVSGLPEHSDVVVFITDPPPSGDKTAWTLHVRTDVNQFVDNLEMLNPRRLVWWSERASSDACSLEECWICDRGAFLQMQHVDKCFQLAEEGAGTREYTHVIRIRPDFYLPYQLNHTQLAADAPDGALFTNPTPRNVADDMFWVVPWATYIRWWRNGMRQFIQSCDKDAAVGPWWAGSDYGAVFNFRNSWARVAKVHGVPEQYPISTIHRYENTSNAFKTLTGACVRACEEECQRKMFSQNCCTTPELRSWGDAPFPEPGGQVVYDRENVPLPGRQTKQKLWSTGIVLNDTLVHLILDRPFFKRRGIQVLQVRTPFSNSTEKNDTAFAGAIRILDVRVRDFAS